MIRVCQASHVRGDPCPSSSNPRCAQNPASTLDPRRGVHRPRAVPAPAAHRPARRPAPTPASALASQLSPASAIRSAWPADDGSPTSAAGQVTGSDITVHLLAQAQHQPRETNQEGEAKGSGPPAGGRGHRGGVTPGDSLPISPGCQIPAIELVLEILTPATDNQPATRRIRRIGLQKAGPAAGRVASLVVRGTRTERRRVRHSRAAQHPRCR